MLTPVLFNGVLKMQVPMIPWEHLIAFTALYCGLYMGGHTVKAILRSWNFGAMTTLDSAHVTVSPPAARPPNKTSPQRKRGTLAAVQ